MEASIGCENNRVLGIVYLVLNVWLIRTDQAETT
jgi:hypothetical protein